MINEISELVGKEYLAAASGIYKNIAHMQNKDEVDLLSNNTITEIDVRLVNNTVTSMPQRSK